MKIDWMRLGRDLAVIVLGVVVALTFENWASGRSERRLERDYLARLSRDLKADSVLIESYLRQAARGEQAARALLTMLERPTANVPDSVIARHFSDATRGVNSYGNRATFDDLTSTGNLRLLRDSKLRDRVLNYYAHVERVRGGIETVVRRGREPLGEVGWDIRAFDGALSYAVTRAPGKGPGDLDRAGVVSQRALLQNFLRHPDARRAAQRAITFQGLLARIVEDWRSELVAVRTAL